MIVSFRHVASRSSTNNIWVIALYAEIYKILIRNKIDTGALPALHRSYFRSRYIWSFCVQDRLCPRKPVRIRLSAG